MNFKEVVEALHAGHVPPAPINGKGQRYSASTAKTADVESGGCERRHFFEQVVGIDPPMTGPALLIGTKVHRFLEKALKTGVELRVDPSASFEERLAAKGIPHLPPHGTPGMHIEEPFEMSTWPGGPTFTGTADLYLEPEGYSTMEEDDELLESAELHDHKTTGSHARYAAMGWALSGDDKRGDGNKARKFLSDDVQNIAYSTRLLRKYPIKRVESKWGYFQKDGGPHIIVPATMEREETLEKWRTKVLPLLETMQQQHQQRPSLLTVPANLNACDSFKGCPHRAYCTGYKQGNGAMGKLSEQISKGHTNIKDEKKETKAETKKETKAEVALNPPPLGKNPFAGAKELPKAATSTHEEEQNEKAKTAKAHQDKEPAHQTKAPASTGAPPTGAPPTGAGFALFLGCEPIVSKRPTVRLALVLAPLEEQVAKANKVGHIGLVKYDAAQHLCAALDDWFSDNGADWDGVNVVVGKSALHLDVAERVLLSKAVAASQALA